MKHYIGITGHPNREIRNILCSHLFSGLRLCADISRLRKMARAIMTHGALALSDHDVAVAEAPDIWRAGDGLPDV